MPVERLSSAVTDRRGSKREPVLLAGSAFGLARSRSVMVSDLSPDGAQLDGRDLPSPGEDLLMIVASFDSLAKVVWRTGDKCGIVFDDTMSDKAIVGMKEKGKWAAVTGWYR